MEEMWCQGYSEPEGGSDLTHLTTTAIRDGDEYVVNGSKIWTGHAMHADWMVLLCRTDPEEKGSKGLSMLMVDLHNTPGVEIYPIRHMTGGGDVLPGVLHGRPGPGGEPGGPARHGGWLAAATLLEHERALGRWDRRWRRSAGCSTTLLAMVAERGGVRRLAGRQDRARWSSRWRPPAPWSYDSAAYLSRGEGFPPNMTHAAQAHRHGRGHAAGGAGV